MVELAHCTPAAPSALALRWMVPGLDQIVLANGSLRCHRYAALLIGRPWVEVPMTRILQASPRFICAPAHTGCAWSPFRRFAKRSVMLRPLDMIAKIDGAERTLVPVQQVLREVWPFAFFRTLCPIWKVSSLLVWKSSSSSISRSAGSVRSISSTRSWEVSSSHDVGVGDGGPREAFAA